MIAMIDNYDSFTYNIVQELREMGADLRVFRNDAVSAADLLALAPSGLVVSPGPGRPEDAGVSLAAIAAFEERRLPVLGICLGHQAICALHGGRIVKAPRVMHGKVSEVVSDGEGIFKGLGTRPFKAMRYHSLCLDPESTPECLEISATAADDGCTMGVRHRELPVHGVQFHPESIMTPSGKRILRNFLRLAE